jgi:hypothetical protein
MKKYYSLGYKYINSTVSRIIYLDILLIKLYLKYIVRGRRFVKRLFKYLNSVLYALIIILLYITLIYFIGKKLGFYNSLFDTIWETKNTIVSSIIIVYISNVIKNEKDRNDVLKKQFAFYGSIYFITDNIMAAVSGLIDCPHNYYYLMYQDIYDEFRNYVMNYNFNTTFSKTKLNNFRRQYKEALSDLNTITYKLNSIDLIASDMDYSQLKKYIKKIANILHKIESNVVTGKVDTLKDDILTLCDELYYLVAELRKPWRWDLKRDNEIRKLLIDNNLNTKHCIAEKRID